MKQYETSTFTIRSENILFSKESKEKYVYKTQSRTNR